MSLPTVTNVNLLFFIGHGSVFNFSILLVENTDDGVYKGMKELLDNRESLPNYKRQSLKRYYYYEDDIVIKDIINLFSHEQ